MESGKFVLRISPQLHRQLKEEALQRGVSLNELCVERLSFKDLENSNQEKILLQLSAQFLGADLIGIIKTQRKIFLFLKPSRTINALLEWDYEEAVLEKLNFRPEVKFLNLPSEIEKISMDFREAVIFGQILLDQNGELFKTAQKLKKLLLNLKNENVLSSV